MKKKGIIAAVIAACLAFALSGGVAYAYLTDKNSIKNEFTVGIGETKLMEEFEPVPLDVGDNIYKKAIWVKNVGTRPCFVRVFLGFSDSEIEDITQFSGADGVFYSVKKYPEHLPEGWVYDGDYFYYTKPLQPGEETTKVIEKVKTTFATEEEVREYDLIAFEESIDTLGIDGTVFSGTDAYRKAWDEYLTR